MLSHYEQVIKEFACMFIAVIAGLLTYRHLNKFYRLLLLQVVVSSVIYFIVEKIPDNFNYPVYNAAMIIEISILLIAFHSYFKNKTMNYVLLFLFFMLLLIDGIQLYIMGIHSFLNFGYVSGGIVIAGICTFIFFNNLNSMTSVKESSAIIFVSFGLLVYFACSAPYLCMFYYLDNHAPAWYRKLFSLVNITSNIRYSFLTIGFWLFRRNAILKNVPNE
jgi:hypothetical protein